MKEDTEGWHGAPAGLYWACPDCKELSPIEAWQQCDVPCDTCGDHDARMCPGCWSAWDHVWGAPEIARATRTKNLSGAVKKTK